MAENKKNIASVGGVGLDLTLNDSGLYTEVKQAADKVKAQFVREFANIGKETDNTFKKSFSGVTTSSKTAANHVKDQFSKSAKAAGSEVEKQLKTSFNEVSSASNSMSESLVGGLKKVGAAVIAAFSVAKIKEFGQSAIEQAARMNAQQSTLTQTFREYEGAAVKAMKEVANESGILDTRLQSVGTQIFAFAKTSGMDSASALNMMKEALQATADSAAYYDHSLEDTAESLKSFLKGNYANDAALGVSATETTRNAAAMKLYGQSFKDLSEAQKQLTLLQMVKDANALSGAMGQAAREADGWENVIGNLKESWNQLLAAVGKPILQGAIVVIKNLIEWISNLASYAKAASQALGQLFGWGTNNSEQTAATAANTAQTAASIADSVDNQNELTQAVAKTNAEVKRGIAGFDRLNIISKSSAESSDPDNKNSNTGSALNTISPSQISDNLGVSSAEEKIDELTRKVKFFFQTLYHTSGLKAFVDEFKKSFDRIDDEYIHSNFRKIGEDVFDIVKEVSPALTDLNNSLGGFFGGVAGLGNTILGKTIEVVSGGIRKWLDDDKEYISETFKEISKNFGGGFDNLTPIFDDLSDKAAAIFDFLRPFTENNIAASLSAATHLIGELSKLGSSNFETVTEGLRKTYFYFTNDFPEDVNSALQAIRAEFSQVWGKISEGYHVVVDPWIEIIKRAYTVTNELVFKPVGERISEFFGGTRKKADEAVSGVKEAFSPLAEWFGNIFSKAWEKVKNVFSKGGEVFRGIKEGIFEAFKAVVNGLIDGINTVIGKTFSGLNNALTAIHDAEILGIKPFEGWVHPVDVPVIPRLARGGIVRAPTLAVVGDNPGAGSGNPEVISPLNKLQSMMNTSNGEDTLILTRILDLLTRMYEMTYINRKQGGGNMTFTAELNGEPLFCETIRQNEMYKDRHGGRSAYA